MIILKEGKVHKHKFTCPRCGCEFVADKNEYRYNSNIEFTGLYNGMTSIPQKRVTTNFSCECPNCLNLVEDTLITTSVDKIKDFCKSWTQD